MSVAVVLDVASEFSKCDKVDKAVVVMHRKGGKMNFCLTNQFAPYRPCLFQCDLPYPLFMLLKMTKSKITVSGCPSSYKRIQSNDLVNTLLI